MAKAPRKKTLNPPRNAWESALEEAEGRDRSQAGEIEDERGGGDKGIDAHTGQGGYGGDAALAGEEESAVQSERPLDREIHGDPRTRQGQSYPDEVKRRDEQQHPMGQSIDEDLEREDRDQD